MQRSFSFYILIQNEMSMAKNESWDSNDVEYYDDEALQTLYNKDYFKDAYEIYKKWHVKADFINKTFFPKNFLDIGCAEGWIVSELIKLGVNAYGIDGSSYALSKVEQSVKERVFQVNLNDGKIPFPDGYFDVIFSSHTIEHVHRIDNYLKELNRVMKEGGKAWIITPDSPKSENIRDVNMKTSRKWKKLFLNYGFIVKNQRQYGFMDFRGRLKMFKLYKLPEPLQTWVKFTIYGIHNKFGKKTAEASMLLVKRKTKFKK